MKKIYLTSIVILFAIGVFAQSIVTTVPQMKNVILEEYTGVNCSYCPDGHKISHEIMTENLNRAFAINIHQGGYAETTPDYTTSFGDALANQTGLSGYPSGTVNRHTFPGLTATALDRGQWSLASKLILEQPSPVNVGLETSYNSTTRELTIDVEVFYTDASATTSNYLNVALVQNNIEGSQAGSSLNPDMVLPNGNYLHSHMLRHLITGQWGEEVTPTTGGTLVTKTYTYTIPEDYFSIPCIPTDCDIVAYVTESHQEILTGVQVPVSGGTNDGTTETYIGPLTNALTDIVNSDNGETENFTLSGISLLQGDEDFIYTLTTDAPGNWAANFTVDGTDYTGNTTITMSNGVSEDVTINVTTGATPGLATYTLEMKSATYPDAPVQIQSVYVISGVTDLIVNGSGSFGDTNEYNFDEVYDLALANTGCTTYAHTKASVMEKGITSNAFDGVNNIYMNIGWTFPSFQDEEVNALTTFMDNGGNLFVSGQDMGWDIMSGDGYGTTTTENFFEDYLSANFSNDGSTSNNQLQAISGDVVFGDIPSTTITDVYDGNMFPDQITPRDGAISIFNYNGSASKISGVRKNSGTYKVVYLGVGLEMLQDEVVRFAIIDQSYKWFNNVIGIDNISFEKLVNVYPNPANNNLNIDFKANELNDIKVDLMDILGKTLYSTVISNTNEFSKSINIENHANGIYLLKISNGVNQTIKRIDIQK